MKLQVDRSSPRGRIPTVRVVVPCYNYGRYLPDCVGSVLSQEGVAVEVVVIDDASTDDSADVARALARADDRVSVIVHEQNRGHIRTYNEGLSTATTDYLVLLSADDMLAPGALGRATRVMEQNPNVGLVYGRPENFVDAPPEAGRRRAGRTIWPGRRWIGHQFRRGLGIIFSPEAVVRTSVHREAGWYRETLPHSGDLEMWLRIADLADVARVRGPAQAYRRVHAASMMQTSFAAPVADLEERVRAYESFLSTSRLPAPEVARLRRIMAATLAHEAFGWLCRAHESGGAASADAAAYVAFIDAVRPELWDSAAGREWRARGRPDAPFAKVRIAGGELSRRVTGAIRWRRWHHLGI